MGASESPRARLERLEATSWSGTAWRTHRAKYDADDPGGSYRVSGRFNRGLDRFPEGEIFPALYLSLDRAGTLGEVLRHLPPNLSFGALKDFRLSRLSLGLSRVLDCRGLEQLGVTGEALLHDTDYSTGQSLAAAAVERGAEGILVPSATRLGDNLIVFPDNMLPSSTIETVGFESLRHLRPPG